MVFLVNWLFIALLIYIYIDELNVRNDKMDDKIFQNSLCIISMKQKLSGPIEAHGPFIFNLLLIYNITYKYTEYIQSSPFILPPLGKLTLGVI